MIFCAKKCAISGRRHPRIQIAELRTQACAINLHLRRDGGLRYAIQPCLRVFRPILAIEHNIAIKHCDIFNIAWN